MSSFDRRRRPERPARASSRSGHALARTTRLPATFMLKSSAEGGRFELPRAFGTLAVFKTATFNHSVTPPESAPDLGGAPDDCKHGRRENMGAGLRILVFCPTFGELGGIERKAESLLAEFRAKGCEVAVLARGRDACAARMGVTEFR